MYQPIIAYAEITEHIPAVVESSKYFYNPKNTEIGTTNMAMNIIRNSTATFLLCKGTPNLLHV